jgi:hypothetical protein
MTAAEASVEKEEPPPRLPVHVELVLAVMNIKVLLSDGTLLYYLLYVLFTWLGNFVSEFFFCFHLLDIVHRSPTLQVLRAAVPCPCSRSPP